jgi:arylsulfatase A-like enzyme
MIRDQLAEYYSMMAHLDAQIGRILAALRKSGQFDNTIIVYAADNGLAVGSHGLLGKQSVFEHSTRVPLIFSGPGIPRGELAGVHLPLRHLPDALRRRGPRRARRRFRREPAADLGGPPGEDPRLVFLPYIQVQRAVRDERWKLIAYPKLGFLQLFDLQADPHERRASTTCRATPRTWPASSA